MRLEGELRADLQWETILGQVPSKKNNYTIGFNRANGERHIIKSERMREYERNFARQCVVYKDRNIDRPFKLHMVVYEISWSYDLDNALGGVLDCMQYNRCITNDNLAVEIDCRKVIDPSNPRIMYAIEELEPKLF